MRRPLAVLFFAALLAVTPAAMAAPSWTVDMAQSRLGFVGTQMGAPFEGRFQRFATSVAFSPDDLAGSRVVVTIDMASADTGNRERDGLLPARPWFDVATHPEAKFATTGFRHLGGNRFEVAGTLTLRGRSRDLVIPVSIDIAGAEARVEGATKINRLDFGIGEGEWANPAVVGLEVEIRFALTARREG